jgi:hypothetical protein
MVIYMLIFYVFLNMWISELIQACIPYNRYTMFRVCRQLIYLVWALFYTEYTLRCGIHMALGRNTPCSFFTPRIWCTILFIWTIILCEGHYLRLIYWMVVTSNSELVSTDLIDLSEIGDEIGLTFGYISMLWLRIRTLDLIIQCSSMCLTLLRYASFECFGPA